MEELIARARARQHELERQLQDPAVIGNRERFASLSREYAELQEALRSQEELLLARKHRHDADEIVRHEHDPGMRTLAEQERERLDRDISALSAKVRDILDPPDPRDRKDIVVEIRSGVGGEEAALFAAELFRMYVRYAERHHWRTQLVNESRTTLGGFKEVIFEMNGGAVFRDLKFESGVHRVQRVPDTERSGRVHTSTVTVVVLPEADEVEVRVDPKDLEITATTSSGHGGQSVNTTYSAIRVTHLPTGITVNCQDERSQTQNREKALRILRARLLAHEASKRQQEASTVRKLLIGTGERSEKIRTYNFPQDRVTDHRLQESFHGLARILNGELEPIIERLQTWERSLDATPKS